MNPAPSLYVVSPDGLVQRLPYTGTAWSTNLPTYDTTLLGGHTIVAVPDGKVLVGAGTLTDLPGSLLRRQGRHLHGSSLTPSIGHGNEHVIFDVDFKNNNFIYMGDDNAVGATNPARSTATRSRPSPGGSTTT